MAYLRLMGYIASKESVWSDFHGPGGGDEYMVDYGKLQRAQPDFS